MKGIKSSARESAVRVLKNPKSSLDARRAAASALVQIGVVNSRLRRSIDVRALDKVADRLGDLYQNVGKLSGRSVSARNKLHASVLDEIIALTAEIERISGRKKNG